MERRKYDEDFKVFWKEYPARWVASSDRWAKLNKNRAWEQWKKLDTETKEHIMAIMPVFIKTIPSTNVQDAFRWLNDKNKGYADYSVPKPPSPKPRIIKTRQVHKPLTDEEKAELLEHKKKVWPKWLQQRMGIK